MGFHMYSPLQGTFVDYITLKDMILKKRRQQSKTKTVYMHAKIVYVHHFLMILSSFLEQENT